MLSPSPAAAVALGARHSWTSGARATLAVAVAMGVGAGALATVPASPEVVWLVVLWAVWIVSMIWAFTCRELPVGFLALTLWTGLNVVAGATVAVANGSTELGRYDLTPGTVGALQVWVWAQAGLLVGAIVVHARPSVRLRRAVPTVPARTLDRWSILLLAAGVTSLGLFVLLARPSLSSLNVLGGDAVYGDIGRTAEGSVVQQLKVLGGFAGAAIIVAALRLTWWGRARAWVPVAVIIGSVVVLGLLGGRSQVVVPALAAALVWLKTTRSPVARTPRRFFLLGVLVVFGFAVVVGGLRGQAEKDLDLGAFATKELRGGIFPATAGLVTVVPDTQPYLDGASFVDAATVVVPRAVWPEKPGNALDDIQLAIFGSNIGASFAWPGEFYANLGFGGVFVGCALTVTLAEWLWRRAAGATRLAVALPGIVGLVVLVQVFSRGYAGPLVLGQSGLIIGTACVVVGLRRREGPGLVPGDAGRSGSSDPAVSRAPVR